MAGLRTGIGGSLVLDAEGLVKVASGDRRAHDALTAARARNGRVVAAASTLSQVMRGGRRDVNLHRLLKRVTVVSIDAALGRAAGELLGRAGLSGHSAALDALVAVVALDQPRPVMLLTSDPHDLGRLTDEPDRPRRERIVIVRI